MNDLTNHINSISSISEPEMRLIAEKAVKVSIHSNTIVLKMNSIHKYIYFLNSGIVKGYQNNDGKIVIHHLIESKNFFTDYESFHKNISSTEAYEAINRVELYKISRCNFLFLQEKIPSFSGIINTIYNEALQCKMKRINDFQTLSAKQRYAKLLQEQPNLVQNVPVNDLASYLGIAAPSLSRIRKQIF